MNKAYLLVICLLAASFTGCLADDPSDLEDEQNTEEETIEPVGTNNNETNDYEVLIGEIQNLTDEIEELNNQINILDKDLESLSEIIQASTYKPPANSSASFTTVANHEMEIDIQMINETTIILNMSGQQNFEHAVIGFYNFHGGVIQFGEVRDLYDYCEYREYVQHSDENGTWTGAGFVYTWSEGKVNNCDSDSGEAMKYVFELPYQPTSVGFSRYTDSTNTVDHIITFH
tara:strand:+ start:163 stop:855 length:693 start_codon:yes stop_codon:yes gene_type:complete